MYGGAFAFQNQISKCVSLWKEGDLPFLLCFTLYLRANSKYKPPPRGGGAYIWRGDLGEGFWGVYIWRGLYMEGLIFGILW